MGNVREKRGKLFFDFRYQGVRCREYTKLRDTPSNRKRMQKVLDQIEQAIVTSTFQYADFFPGSALVEKFADSGASQAVSRALPAGARAVPGTPLFRTFIEDWFTLSLPSWRKSHAATVRSTIDCHLTPHLGDIPVAEITKTHILQMRVEIAKRKGRGGNETLSAKTINRIIQLLHQALADAGEQYGFTNPTERIKRLKQRRIDILPFSFAETRLIIHTVRADYRLYLIVRFLTGMRTGEIHGLQWRYVDFERRQILVRKTFVRGNIEDTKTDGSQREIAMSEPVYEALLAQRQRTGEQAFVFCTANGSPMDNDNFTNRVWYPLLRHLGLAVRRPYQTRHTCATLWLAAGENPEWVARQLGHVNTAMLFKTYSRFIPNLTRTDGSAFNSLVSSVIDHPNASPVSTVDGLARAPLEMHP
ncbi:MAG: Arm DNA-binding domain-containing protein [Metallibacterium scheffleri]